MVTELHGSGRIRFTPEGRSAERIYHVVPYDDAEAFCQSLLGTSGMGILRTAPARFAADSPLWAVRATIEGLGKSGVDGEGNIRYEGGARVVVEYQTLNWNPERDPDDRLDDPREATFLSEEVNFAAEYLTLPKTKFEWASDSEPLTESDVAPGMLLPKAEWTLTRHRAASLERDAIFAAIGRVNAAVMSGLEAETLLLVGATARREITSDGSTAWTISFSFQYNPAGHNTCFRGSSSKFDTVQTIDGSPQQKIYETTNFQALIPELS